MRLLDSAARPGERLHGAHDVFFTVGLPRQLGLHER
jgi:hypothetical protein